MIVSTPVSCNSLNIVTDIVTLVISALNLAFVVGFSIFTICQNNKVYQIEDNKTWFDSFEIKKRVAKLIGSFRLFREKLIECVDSKDLNNIQMQYRQCIFELNKFKDDYIDLINALYPHLVAEFAKAVLEVEDKAAGVFGLIMAEKNKKEAVVSGINEIVSFMINKIITETHSIMLCDKKSKD